MKNIILVFIIFVSVRSFSQLPSFPLQTQVGSPTTKYQTQGPYKSFIGFIYGRSYADTAALNSELYLRHTAGIQVLVGDTTYIRSQDISRWIKQGAGSSSGGGQVNTVTISNFLPLFATGVGGTATDPVFTFAAMNQSGNVVFASPANGSLGVPDFRSLVAADFPAGAISGNQNNVAYYDATTGAISPGVGELSFRASTNSLSNTMGVLRVWYRDPSQLGPEALIHASGNDIGNMYMRIQNAYNGSSNGNAISYQLIDSVSGKVAQLYLGHSTNVFTGNAVMLHSNSDFIKLHSESGPIDLATGALNVPGVNTVVRVTTAARVGIGTLTPGQKLSVIGSFSTTDSTIFRGLTTGSSSDSVLTTSSGLTKRVEQGALAVRISSLVAANATNTIDNLNFAQSWVWTTLSNATALSIASNSSTANSSTTQLMSIANTAGAIGTSATLRGLNINLSAGGASGSTSTGLFVSVTNAVNNNAIIVSPNGGLVGIGNSTPVALLTLGTAGTQAGRFSIAGSSSGTITFQPAAAAGTYTLTMPIDDGTASQFLQTDGNGVLTWATGSSSSAISALTAAVGTNSILNSTFAQTWNWDQLRTGNALTINGGLAASTTTADIRLLNIDANDIVVQDGHTLYALYADASPAGGVGPTTSRSIAVYANATNSIVNHAIFVDAGTVNLNPLTATTILGLNASKNIVSAALSGLTWDGTTLTVTASSGITIGTTTITSGTSGRHLYNNAGVVGEAIIGYGLSGTTTLVADTTILVNKANTQIIVGAKTFTGGITISSPSNAFRYTNSIDAGGNFIQDANVDYIIRRGGANVMNWAAALITLQSGVGLNVDANTLFVHATNNGVGFGTATPTARGHFIASTTAVSGASIKIGEGSRQTTPEDGTINYVANNLEFVETSTVYTVAKSLTGTATLDFGSTVAGTSTDLTITLTGVADGEAVSLGVPNGSTLTNGVFTAWVSAANTVTVRFSNNSLAATLDPASGSFRVSVIKP